MRRTNSVHANHSIRLIDRLLRKHLLPSLTLLAPIIVFGAANASAADYVPPHCRSNAQCSKGAVCEYTEISEFFGGGDCGIKSPDGIKITFAMEFDKAQGMYRQSDRLQWISFAGAITQQSVEHLRQILTRYQPQLPKTDMRSHFRLLIDSPGGDVYAAMDLGRLLRANQVSISPAGSALNNGNGFCASACVLAWVGAPIRAVASDKSLFIIHRPYGFANAQQGLAGASVQWKAMQDDIRRYLVEMNIPPTLLDAMNEVPSEDGRTLTPTELSRYLLDSDDPAYTELYDAGEAQKRGISRMEYLARKRRVAECQERVDSQDYPDSSAYYRAVSSCHMLYDPANGLSQLGQQAVDELKKAEYGVSRCAMHTAFATDGLTVAVSADGEFFAGDVVIAVAGEKVDVATRWPVRELLKKHGPNEIIPIKIRRAAKDKVITVKCMDVKPYFTLILEAGYAASKNDPATCADKMNAARNLAPLSAASMNLAYKCADFARRLTPADQAHGLYDINREWILENEWSSDALSKLRGTILSAVDWLQKNNASLLGDDLRQQYEQALSAKAPATAASNGAR